MSTPMGETAQGGSGDTPTATQEKGGRNDAHAFFTEGAPIKTGEPIATITSAPAAEQPAAE